MAHRIAELMERVEAAEAPAEREAASAACSEAILALWARRQHWPYGAPLSRVAEALDALAGPPAQHEPDRPEGGVGWIGALPVLDRLGTEEWDVARQAAVAAMDLTDEAELLETAGDTLSDDERHVIESLLEFQRRQRTGFFLLGPLRVTDFGTLDAAGRAERVDEALAEIDRRRQAALDKARSEARGGNPDD